MTARKGPDHGVDGYMFFRDYDSGRLKEVVVSVKGGKVGVKGLRDLVGTMDREKAPVGTLIRLRKPTDPMKGEALTAGFYEPEVIGGRYPRVQIITVEEGLKGNPLKIPHDVDTFRKAAPRSKMVNHKLIDSDV
jgi:site-specific DNA-methyltransferase (adenine-specific)